ncbi:hypothetical protein ASPCAL01389 [Aspergillus calidoustus]|uniref:Metallo-beta-lactamase domain-containing protein n=1 Tax=Aspergillus calidoustus TaxID=454130 RepID=A0A0U5FRA0_ASPCI|nr:hypothetical protein ASPCAL01389 [Aspergillus calidoustus]
MAEATPPLQFKATWIGTSMILFDDGVTSVLIDGFFTRPSFISTIFWKVSSDEAIVTRCLEKAGIANQLQAVFVAHSHHDHVLDSPTICARTGAKLVGSESTRLVGEGYGLPQDQNIIVSDGDVLQFGAFRITIFEGLHSLGDLCPGELTEPLSGPCRYTAFKTDKCYSYLIEHGAERVFVHPSANFVPGKFRDLRCGTVFLSTGTLGKQPVEFRDQYWDETVGMMEPKRVIPIHWDAFWTPIDSPGPVAPLPWPFDKWAVTTAWMEERGAAAGVEIYLPKLWEEFVFG